MIHYFPPQPFISFSLHDFNPKVEVTQDVRNSQLRHTPPVYHNRTRTAPVNNTCAFIINIVQDMFETIIL